MKPKSPSSLPSPSLGVRAAAVAVTSALVAACAAGAPSAKAPAAAAPAGYGQYPGADASYAQQPGYPQPQPGAAPQPAQPGQFAPPPPPREPPSAGQPGGGGSSRSMAFSGAANEIDSSQRELDVAAGDCNVACRALGSMDRACGRLCELAQGSDEGRRCEDAKKRVYSARDRVKQTCTACGPGGPSVERSAPIPSVR